MPRKKDPSLTTTTKTGSTIYQSRYDRNQLYDDAQTERVIVRVPYGAKKIIEEYQKAHNEEFTSVNALVNKLLEREILGEGHTFKEALGVSNEGAVQPTELQKKAHREKIDKRNQTK